MLANPGTKPCWVILALSGHFSFASPHFAPSRAEHAWPPHTIQVQLQLPLEDSFTHPAPSLLVLWDFSPVLAQDGEEPMAAQRCWSCSVLTDVGTMCHQLSSPYNPAPSSGTGWHPPEGHSRRAGGASLLPCSRRTCRRQRSSVHRQVKISPPKHSSNSWDGQRPAGGVDERLGATTGRCPASTGLHWFAAPLALGTFWLPAPLHGWFPGPRGCSVLPSLEPAARPRASPGLTQLAGATLPEGFPMSRGGAP